VSPWQLTAAAAAAGLLFSSVCTSSVTSSLTSSEPLRDEQLWCGAIGLADEHATSI